MTAVGELVPGRRNGCHGCDGAGRPDHGRPASWLSWIPVAPPSFAWILVVVMVTVPVMGLQCGPCEDERCPSLTCPGGRLTDPCGCCAECARQVNESCGGGTSHVLGRCDVGLTCTSSPDPGSPVVNDMAEGVCTETADVVPDQPPCDPAKCTTQDLQVLPCPNDTVTVLTKLSPDSDVCCPERTSCVCHPCDSQPLQCGDDQLPVVVAKGTGLPGNCCDVRECQDKNMVCANVTCAGDDKGITCPPDSYALPGIPTQGGCCSQFQGCKCKSKESCVPLTCPPGQRLQVIATATDNPGSCCDQEHCVNDSSKSCMYKSVSYQDGETWQLDECMTCYCQSKLVFCSAIKCDTAPPVACGWLGLEDGLCCPVCKGCIAEDGNRYENGATWAQDECIQCRCEDGNRFCQASHCAIQCAHPRIVPGRCCPVCDDTAEETMITVPQHCPPLDNCTQSCVNGMRQGEDGCYICQCNPETTDKCNLDCPTGYKLGEDGEKMCECFDEPRTPPAVKCPSLHRCQKQCDWGYRKKANGCPKCRCNKCPPYLCKKTCPYGHVHEKGCKLCTCQEPVRPTSLVSTTWLPPGRSSCMSVGGYYMEDGEMWFDGCRRCFCYQGYEWCSLITCPPLKCLSPVIRPADCCPTCPEDDGGSQAPGLPTKCHASGGTVRSEGDTWRLDECTQCICHAGGILCQIKSCPPLLCHHPIRYRSACCPVCPEGSGFFPRPAVQSARSCTTAAGIKFSDGDTWRVNACQSCVCRQGQVYCFSQTCPLRTCNRTLFKKGQCCPFCADERTSSTCIHNGQVYKANDSWLAEPCTRCQCINGQSVCSAVQCPTPACRHPVHVPDVCCTICPIGGTLNTTPPVVDYPPRPNQSHPRPPPDGAHDTPKEEGRQFPITYTVLIAVVVLLILVVILLLILLLRTRRKTDSPLVLPKVSPKVTEVLMASSDHKTRPKSTNVELQGMTPLLNGKCPLANGSLPQQNGQTRVVCNGAIPVTLQNGHGPTNVDKVANTWPQQEADGKTYHKSSAEEKLN